MNYRAQIGLLAAGIAVLGAVGACVGDAPVNPGADAGADASPPLDSGSGDAAPDAPVNPSCADAGLSSCNGVCVDVATSVTNCGACGRSCLGAACTLGRCAASQVASGLSNPYVVRNSTTPDVLVVASDDPYKDAGPATGGLFRVPKPSGAPTRMWTSTTPVMNGRSAVAVDGTYAFFITRNGNTAAFSRVDLNGAPTSTPIPLTIANINSTFFTVAAVTTDAGVFQAAGSPYQTYMRADNAASVAVLSTGGGRSIALPAALDLLVVADDSASSILTCARTNPVVACNPLYGTKVYSGPLATAPDFLETLGTTLFWVNNGATASIIACTLPTCATPKVLVSNEADIGGLAVDATGVYWTDPIGGRIRVCHDLTTGCGTTSETLADTQPNATGITTDGAFVYWTIRAPAGFVRRVAK